MTVNDKRNYWGIVADEVVTFSGTFNQCWEKFVEQLGDYRLQELSVQNIRIARIK